MEVIDTILDYLETYPKGYGYIIDARTVPDIRAKLKATRFSVNIVYNVLVNTFTNMFTSRHNTPLPIISL